MGGRKRSARMSGIFSWVKKIFAPPFKKVESTLPVLWEPQLPAVARGTEKTLAPFEIFRPRELIKKPLETFEMFVPPEPPAAAPRTVLWEEFIAPPEESLSVEEAFSFLRPEAVLERRAYGDPSEWPYGEPPFWTYTRWQMPTTLELANLVKNRWDTNGIYEYVLNQVERPEWRRRVEESAHLGEPAAMDIELISGRADPYGDVARLLSIPEVVIEEYGKHGPEGAERFAVEVLQPMADRVGKALDALRPTRALRGWFDLEPDDDMNFWIRYKEAPYLQAG